MKTQEFKSYCGDTYEKWASEQGHVRYRRIKKVSNPDWTPRPRPLTTAEVMAQLKAERDRYRQALEKILAVKGLDADQLEAIVDIAESALAGVVA